MTDNNKGTCGNCSPTMTISKGRRVMIAQTKGRYEPGQAHPQCQDCLENFLNSPELQKVRLEDLKAFIEKQK